MGKNDSPVEYDADEAAFAQAFLSAGGANGRPMEDLHDDDEVDEELEVDDEDVSDDEDESLEDDTDSEEDEPDDDADTDSKLTREQAIKLLKKTRKEAAQKRILTRDQKKELDDFKKWRDSQKSEVDKLKEENRALKAAQRASDFEKAQRKAARSAKLPVEFADRLKGDSPEELLEDAKELAKVLGRPSKSTRTTASGMFAGNRGAAVGQNVVDDEQAWFMDAWENAK